MNGDDPKQQDSGSKPPREKAARSGEGADTALEALIRKRKQAENHDAPDSMLPPLPDATPDPAAR